MSWFDKDKKKDVIVEKPIIIETIKTNMPEKMEDVVVSKLPDPDPIPTVIEATPIPPSKALEVPNVPVVDALSLVYFIWILYRLNIITRIQVKDFLQIIREGKWPQDVVRYLSDEVKKL